MIPQIEGPIDSAGDNLRYLGSLTNNAVGPSQITPQIANLEPGTIINFTYKEAL